MKIFSCLLLLLCLVVFPACADKDAKDASLNDRSEDSTESTPIDSAQTHNEATGHDTSHSQSHSQAVPAPTDPTEERSVDQEKAGPLYLGQLASDVVAAIGAPKAKSEMQVWGVDGLERQTWTYNAKGIRLTMLNMPNEALTVDQIDLDEHCTLKTERGIGIGSSRKATLAAYANDLAVPEERLDDESVVAGSIFGGIVFTMQDDKVSGIFIGAAAE